jgi:hypothetical protein
MLTNNTPHAVAHAMLMTPEGVEALVVVVKATFAWQPDGSLGPVPEPPAVHAVDVYGGDPATTGLVATAELTLAKPRVDVLLEGELVPPRPIEQIDFMLEIGRRVRKVVRVFGPRYFVPSAVKEQLVPSRPKAFARIPIAWERSFGGTDPGEPSVFEPRNPVGCGVRKRVADLKGQPAPSFEDPRAPITHAGLKATPVGLGPVAPHWLPRRGWAGTYDEVWQKERFPLLPENFDPRFLNAAPLDQQLDGYQPGEPVRFGYLGGAALDEFTLPELAPPVTVVDGKMIVEVASRVDTIVIAPAERRVSVVARALYVPAPEGGPLKLVYVGPLTRGQRRALEVGKPYVRAGR